MVSSGSSAGPSDKAVVDEAKAAGRVPLELPESLACAMSAILRRMRSRSARAE